MKAKLIGLAALLSAFAADVQAAEPAPALSVDTVLEQIVADERGLAVLNRYVFNLIHGPAYEYARKKSLREIQPLSQGRISPEKLALIDSELKALSAGQ